MTRPAFHLTKHVEHPGVLLKKHYITMAGLSKSQTRKLLGWPLVVFNEVLMGRARISPEQAADLARVFNTTQSFWILLQAVYDEVNPPKSKVSDADCN